MAITEKMLNLLTHKIDTHRNMTLVNLSNTDINDSKAILEKQNIPGWYDILVRFDLSDQNKLNSIIDTIEFSDKFSVRRSSIEAVVWYSYLLNTIFESFLSYPQLFGENIELYTKEIEKYNELKKSNNIDEYVDNNDSFLDFSIITQAAKKSGNKVILHFLNVHEIKSNLLHIYVNGITANRTNPYVWYYTTMDRLSTYMVNPDLPGGGYILEKTGADYRVYDRSIDHLEF